MFVVDLSRVPIAGEWFRVDDALYLVSSIAWQVLTNGEPEYSAIVNLKELPS
jgi:hypothetical protein